jgi:hypothetical protein
MKKDEKKKKQMADRQSGSITSLDLAWWPSRGWWAAQLGVTKPGVVCKFAVLRVTNETKQGLQVFRLVQRASGPRVRTKYFKTTEDPVGLGNDGRVVMYSREVSTTLFYRMHT